MNKKVVRLYPDSGGSESLQGLYLRRDKLAGGNNSSPLVYANFLTSIDGRIALREQGDAHYQLPDELKSDEDFQLFLELYAHADCIITHGGYMRSLASGRLGNVLQLPKQEWTQYMHEWRAEQGLSPNPDVIIVSGSLDFPWHPSLNDSQQRTHIATGGKSDQACKQQWLDAGHHVHEFGSGKHVDVTGLMGFLTQQKYRSVYLVAGPQLLQDFIAHNYIERFFCHYESSVIGWPRF